MNCIAHCEHGAGGECAQHTSAGDFRSEGGFTPQLRQDEAGDWYCSMKPTTDSGSIYKTPNGNFYVYNGPYEGGDREWLNPES